MPFLSIIRRSLHKVAGDGCLRFNAIPTGDTVIRTARPHKHIEKSDDENAVKKAYSAFFKCSITIEASLSLPLFVFAVCILIYPLKVIDAQIRYQTELEKITRNLTAYSYLEKTASGLIGENVSGYSDIVAGAVTAADVIRLADTEILGIPVPTKISMPSDEGDMVEIAAISYVSFPFSEALDIDGFSISFVSKRRAWVGRNGGAGMGYGERKPDSSGEGETEEETYVLVTDNSSVSGRYHLSSECHYVSNTMTAVPASSIPSLRSSDGGKYKPCASCHPGKEGTVFIFRSGNSYHATEECSAIQSFVTEITKTEAEERGLSPCSYCLAHFR